MLVNGIRGKSSITRLVAGARRGEDHLAEMGPSLADVARSLARSLPTGGVCVTAEFEPTGSASSFAIDDVAVVEWRPATGSSYPQAVDCVENAGAAAARLSLVDHGPRRTG